MYFRTVHDQDNGEWMIEVNPKAGNRPADIPKGTFISIEGPMAEQIALDLAAHFQSIGYEPID